MIRSSWPQIGCYLSEHVCDNPQLPEGPVGDLLPDPALMIKCFEGERLIITFILYFWENFFSSAIICKISACLYLPPTMS